MICATAVLGLGGFALLGLFLLGERQLRLDEAAALARPLTAEDYRSAPRQNGIETVPVAPRPVQPVITAKASGWIAGSVGFRRIHPS